MYDMCNKTDNHCQWCSKDASNIFWIHHQKEQEHKAHAHCHEWSGWVVDQGKQFLNILDQKKTYIFFPILLYVIMYSKHNLLFMLTIKWPLSHAIVHTLKTLFAHAYNKAKEYSIPCHIWDSSAELHLGSSMWNVHNLMCLTNCNVFPYLCYWVLWWINSLGTWCTTHHWQAAQV